MQVMTFIKRALLSSFMVLGLNAGASAQQAQPLSLKVYTADSNFNVTSTLVSGKSDAVLIDAQFTLADARRLVAEVLSSGKTLKAIYISHGDPDYYFGLEVIRQAFPQVPIIATASTVAHIKESYQKKLEVWSPRLGANGPHTVIVPEVIQKNFIELEGQHLDIVAPDAELPENTFVWIPSIKAVVGGVMIFGDLHVWTADTQKPAQRQAWIRKLDSIIALQPATVVPGHLKPGTPTDVSAVKYTRDYLGNFETELAKSKDAAGLIKTMQQRYPNSGLGIALDIGAKVNKGEMKW